jgi:hypothetical protein
MYVKWGDVDADLLKAFDKNIHEVPLNESMLFEGQTLYRMAAESVIE